MTINIFTKDVSSRRHVLLINHSEFLVWKSMGTQGQDLVARKPGILNLALKCFGNLLV